MGCWDVIEIKLVGWVAGTGRVETQLRGIHKTHKGVVGGDREGD